MARESGLQESSRGCCRYSSPNKLQMLYPQVFVWTGQDNTAKSSRGIHEDITIVDRDREDKGK